MKSALTTSPQTSLSLWQFLERSALGALLLLPLELSSLSWNKLSVLDSLTALWFSTSSLFFLGVIAGLVWALLLRAWAHSKTSNALLGLFSTLPIAFLLLPLTRGAWIQRQAWLWPAFVSILLAMALSLYLVGRTWLRLRTSPHSKRYLLLFLGLAYLAARLDQTFLVGLYPALHLALAMIALLFAAAAGLLLSWRLPHALPLRSLLLLLLAASLPFLSQQQSAWAAVSSAPLVGHRATIAAVTVGLGPQLPEAGVLEKFTLQWPEEVTRPDLHNADVVLITIDALRADALGSYGSKQNLSPNLDAFAAQSALFTRAYAPHPTSSYSLLSLFTGRYLTSKSSTELGSWKTLASQLEDAGYRSYANFNEGIFFTDAEKFETQRKNLFGFQKYRQEYLDTYEISRDGAAFLAESKQPAFLWLHIAEPHEPYQVRPGFARGDRPEDRYAAEIAYADTHILQILGPIRGRNAIVILTADHGEAFGEHGAYYHTSDVYAEQSWIPFMIQVPGIVPRRIDVPISLVDLAPTILDLLGLPALPETDGRSIAPLLVGAAPDKQPIFSSWSSKHAVAVADHRLRCDQASRQCALFDIRQDPLEQEDISAEQPEVFAKLSQTLAAFLAQQEGAAAFPEALQKLQQGDTSACHTLPDLFQNPDRTVRTETAKRAVLCVDDASTKALLARLADPEEDVRFAVANTLAKRKQADAEPVLRQQRSSSKPSDRAQATLSLAYLGKASLQELAEGLVPSEQETCRALLQEIKSQRGAAADPTLVTAISALLSVGPLLIEAANTLAAIDAKTAVPNLVQALEKSTQIPSRAALVEALGALKDPSAIPALAARAAQGEAGDRVGHAIFRLGGKAPSNATGGLAKRVVRGSSWKCDDTGTCLLTTTTSKVEIVPPKLAEKEEGVLLLSLSGKGTLRYTLAEKTGELTLSETIHDLRILLPANTTTSLQLQLTASETLSLELVMGLPKSADNATFYK